MMEQTALSLVGQGYLYGAKGQICSPAFRAQQAEQYPDQAEMILNTGAKWDGQPVWDCAQLTRAVARAAGVTLPSGATSQWQKGPWQRKGEIGAKPSELVFVYREGEGRMQHTGVALADGSFVHAKGTAYGVVHDTDSRWTHWASPFARKGEMMQTRTVWAPSGSTVNARQTPGGKILFRVPIGAEVEILSAAASWSLIRYENQEAYMQNAYLIDQSLEKRIEAIEQRLDKAGL